MTLKKRKIEVAIAGPSKISTLSQLEYPMNYSKIKNIQNPCDAPNASTCIVQLPTSYLHYIDPSTIEKVMAYPRSVRLLPLSILLCHFLRVYRHLGVCAGALPLRKRTWIDNDDAIDNLIAC